MLVNIALKTEYSFKDCFLHMRDIKHYVLNGYVGVADKDNTFGHIPLQKEADKHGFNPIFGVRLRVSTAGNERKQSGTVYTTFLATDTESLQALYQLVQKAYENFYFFPRLFERDIADLHPGIIQLRTGGHENFYPRAQDRGVYQLLAGARKDNHGGYVHRFNSRLSPQYIIPEEVDQDFLSQFTARVPSASMVKWGNSVDLKQECLKGAAKRKLELTEEYMQRLDYEIDLIKQKDYVDYFMIVSDMVKFAKRTMLVGPSRGSSAGSLVCYLLFITEVDPIVHRLIFERFIDINRFDLPDIDIDFPDKQRADVIEYLVRKYGRGCVRSLANINTLLPKSAIGEFAQALGIPKSATEAVKGAIIERSSGDARAAMCLADTFDTTDPGKEFIAKYPTMRLCERIEGHAAHAGKHAAGIIVSNERLVKFGGINTRDDVIMMDKSAAEHVGLLKIDALGLRTLSILQDTVAQIKGMHFRDIYTLPLDDEETFDVFRKMRLAGVFQYEGYALQSLTRQMGVNHFDDIVAITSLARPGALNSGGASRFVKYRTGVEQPRYFNETHRQITGDTFGITVYQEQMMEIARKIGQLSWQDVSTLRRAASKSLGDEFFGKWKSRFVAGAVEKAGLSQKDAEAIWNDISHSGSWSFNKSHAVSYGLISYWTAYFKAHYPLEFAVASLNNARDDEHAIKLLRDMVKNEGISYVPVDVMKSDVNWSVSNGKLLGGLTNIKGIGPKKAELIKQMRSKQVPVTPWFWKVCDNATTSFDILFPTRHYFATFFNDPLSTGLIDEPPVDIETIQDEGMYLFIGRLVDRNLRDLNEYVFLKDRGGEIIEENNLYLNFTVEDDTDSIICTISRWKYETFGRKIAEEGKVGEDWFLIYGKIRGDWRKINVEHMIWLRQYMRGTK